MSKNKEKGEALFDSFYKNIYAKRWENLKASLIKTDENEKTTIPGLKGDYFLDKASLFVSRLLPLKEGDKVLDMCAAPGGKAMSIALMLNGKGTLVANDRSADRRVRLKNNIEEFLPENCKNTVKVTGHDASKWGLFEKEIYDCILLDAPCSSEAHVLQSRKHLDIWTPNRPKRISKDQYAILSSAFLACKKGGYILYSTCSINPDENEENISRLLKKHPDEVHHVEIENSIGEKRKYGYLILPDLDGMGPMYYALLRKNHE